LFAPTTAVTENEPVLAKKRAALIPLREDIARRIAALGPAYKPASVPAPAPAANDDDDDAAERAE